MVDSTRITSLGIPALHGRQDFTLGESDPYLRPPTHQAVLASAFDVASVVATVATKPAEAVPTGIRLLRAAAAGKFCEQLRCEWDELKAKGQIKDDYEQTDQARVLFQDTLETLSSTNLDAEQLDLIRRLFLAAASESVTDRNGILAREYLAVGRTLSAGEIRILVAYHRYLPEWEAISQRSAQPLGGYGVGEALNVIRSSTILTHVALIEKHERALIDKGLVRGLGPVAGAAQIDRKLFRLTDFGFAFCEFVSAYDKVMKSPSGASAGSPDT